MATQRPAQNRTARNESLTRRVHGGGLNHLRLLLAALVLVAASPLAAQPTSMSVEPSALVRRAVQLREAEAAHHKPLRYLLHKVDERRDTTREIIETKDGDIARLTAIDGKPLSAEANQAELDRLDNLLAHPELQQHRHRAEIKDQQRVIHLLHILPDALLYTFEGSSPCGSGICYRLAFAPNPAFSPPDIEAKVFRGVAGEVYIDQKEESFVKIDAHFIDEVDFGLGLLGKVNQGGHVVLEQTNLGGGDWQIANLTVNMTGRAFLIKTLSIKLIEQLTNFTQAPPNIDYRQAIQLLKAR